MSPYLLMKAVHACFTPDGGIFLDVRNDRYYGVDESTSRTLQAIFAGSAEESDTTRRVADELTKQGLLTTVPSQGHVFRPVKVVTSSVSLPELLADRRPEVKAIDVARFLRACCRMAFMLRFRSLECALSFLGRIRAAGRGNAGAVDEELTRAVEVFRYLRPLIYASRDQCLFDSLVLSYFLQLYRIESTLIFGVKAVPFSAHCWVQSGDLVINGTPSFVGGFVPILAI